MTQNKSPSSLRIVFEVAQVTFRDIIREKILYHSLFFALFIFFLGILASQFTAAHPERMVLDLGLTGVSFSLNVLAGLVGARLLSQEIEKRTLYVILSRPMTRMHFLLGKYFGLSAIIILNWFCLSIAYAWLVYLFQHETSLMTPTLLVALFFGLLESLVVGSLALFFSTFTTTSLSVMFCLGIYLIGKNISELQLILNQAEYRFQKVIFTSVISMIPHLNRYSLGQQATYGIPVSGAFVGIGVLYTVAVIFFCLSLSGLIFRKREF